VCCHRLNLHLSVKEFFLLPPPPPPPPPKGLSAIAPDSAQPQAYCATLSTTVSISLSPMSLVKRDGSFNEAVLMSFGSADSFPNKL
jgi:hypothetical protein